MVVSEEPRGALARASGFAARHPVPTIGAWLAVVAVCIATAVGGVSGQTLFDRLDSAAPTVGGESSDADEVLSGSGSTSTSLSLVVVGVDPRDAAAITITAELAELVADLDGVQLTDPLAAPRQPDGTPLPQLAGQLDLRQGRTRFPGILLPRIIIAARNEGENGNAEEKKSREHGADHEASLFISMRNRFAWEIIMKPSGSEESDFAAAGRWGRGRLAVGPARAFSFPDRGK